MSRNSHLKEITNHKRLRSSGNFPLDSLMDDSGIVSDFVPNSSHSGDEDLRSILERSESGIRQGVEIEEEVEDRLQDEILQTTENRQQNEIQEELDNRRNNMNHNYNQEHDQHQVEILEAPENRPRDHIENEQREEIFEPPENRSRDEIEHEQRVEIPEAPENRPRDDMENERENQRFENLEPPDNENEERLDRSIAENSEDDLEEETELSWSHLPSSPNLIPRHCRGLKPLEKIDFNGSEFVSSTICIKN